MDKPPSATGPEFRRERLLDMAGLAQDRPSPSAEDEEAEIAAILAWLPPARQQLRALEDRRTPWRERSRLDQTLRIVLTVGFWSAGLYVTFLWSMFAFVPFTLFFVLCAIGTWAQTRSIQDLRIAIDDAERLLAHYRRSGHEVPDEPTPGTEQ